MNRHIKSLGEIALRVNDLPAMVEFYRDMIGLELMRLEDRFAFFKIADGAAGHTQVLALFDRSETGGYIAPDPGKSSIDHIAFTVAAKDFGAEEKRLKDLGLKVTTAWHDWVQWRSLYVKDPEANIVEIVCFDPRGDHG